MRREDLKRELLEIREKDFQVEPEKVNGYIDAMMEHIGDEDPVLRDDLIYSGFVQWVEMKKFVSPEKIIEMLKKLISDDYLFYKIGNKGGGSAVKRSFSVLAINPILCRNSEEEFIDEELAVKTHNALVRYMKAEKDLRGYDEKLGWVHCIAHTADAIDMMMNTKGFTVDMCREIMETMSDKIAAGEGYYQAEEYERLVTPIYYNVMEDNILSDEEICSWIETLETKVNEKEGMMRVFARTNVKNFIRSMYFRIELAGGSDMIKKSIMNVEKKLNRFVEE